MLATADYLLYNRISGKTDFGGFTLLSWRFCTA